jgi:hypothetical protein
MNKQFYIYIFNCINPINYSEKPQEIEKKEILNYKIPKEIKLEFIKDDKIFLKDSLNIYVYRFFYLITFITIAINTIGLYKIEENSFYKENILAAKYILPTIFTSQLLFNMVAPMKLNFFKFKISWFVINNFLNVGTVFYLFNIDSAHKKIYIGNTIIYSIISNIIMGVSSLDNKLKIDVNNLIKELEKDNEIQENIFI